MRIIAIEDKVYSISNVDYIELIEHDEDLRMIKKHKHGMDSAEYFIKIKLWNEHHNKILQGIQNKYTVKIKVERFCKIL